MTDHNTKRLFISMILIGVFTIIEFIGGIIANSLALIADSGHMFTDFIAIFLSWFSYRYSSREADEKRTFGYQRAQILAAFANSLILFILSGFIIFEAVVRMSKPEKVEWSTMILVGFIGIIINIVIFFILKSCKNKNLNISSAILHIIGDLLGFVGAIIAALVIKFTGWMMADPIVSIAISLLILVNATHLLRNSGHILLEGMPVELNRYELQQNIMNNVRDVVDIHHFHGWSLSEDYTIVTMHVILKKNVSAFDKVVEIKRYLREKMNIRHATIEVEYTKECSDDVADMD